MTAREKLAAILIVKPSSRAKYNPAGRLSGALPARFETWSVILRTGLKKLAESVDDLVRLHYKPANVRWPVRPPF